MGSRWLSFTLFINEPSAVIKEKVGSVHPREEKAAFYAAFL
jgi:hypothetical protein